MISTLHCILRIVTPEELSRPFGLLGISKDNEFEEANKIISDLQQPSSIEPVIIDDDMEAELSLAEDTTANPPKKKLKKDATFSILYQRNMPLPRKGEGIFFQFLILPTDS